MDHKPTESLTGVTKEDRILLQKLRMHAWSPPPLLVAQTPHFTWNPNTGHADGVHNYTNINTTVSRFLIIRSIYRDRSFLGIYNR